MSMHNRLRLLMAATALLYLGPLLAGLGGFGWMLVPVFAAIFVVWLVVLRPSDWPKSREEWTSPDALVAIGARVAVQLLLVAVCFGIGRGIGGVAGNLPHFPVLVPILMSVLSVVMARLLWDPALEDAEDELAEDTGQDLPVTAEEDGPMSESAVRSAAQAMVETLDDLPADVSENTLAAHLDAMGEHVPATSLLDALANKAAESGAPHVIHKALMILTTTPAVGAAFKGAGAQALAFQVAGDDPDLLGIFARRCAVMIGSDPSLWDDCPATEAVRDVASGIEDPAAASALLALAEAQDAARPQV